MLRLKLFLLSFLMLFLELALIRWIPANVRLVGFFSNLILIGSFFGMGVGFLLSRIKTRLLYLFPFFLLMVISLTNLLQVDINLSSPDVIFFRPIFQGDGVDPPEIVLPIIFFLVSLIFVPLAQEAGKIFIKFRPLTAYTLDILGSVAGIITFTLLAALSYPSFFWFAVITCLGSLIIFTKKKLAILSILTLFLAFLVQYLYVSPNGIWSPYYKILLTKTLRTFPINETIYEVNVNNIGHQYVSHWLTRENFYFYPYNLFTNHFYKKILIIGAGTGADVATALGLDPAVTQIDAVEIDPKLVELGRKLNPDKPYDDPRVHVVINDGRRSFLATSDKYDLIIYALTDSLVLTGNSSNIRLESFLFTKESFTEAQEHLNPGGLFVLYNYYRESWLIDKIAAMLTTAFGKPPYLKSYGKIGKAAVFFAGPKTSEIPAAVKPYVARETLSPATDDWPFLYLKEPGLPAFYLRLIVVTVAVCLSIIFLLQRRVIKANFNWHFFFLGAGFLLLETKSLVNFALLFGATWIVNALVFIAILLSVQIANIISIKHTFKHLWIFYILLFLSLLVNFILPPNFLLTESKWLRYLLAGVIYFSPVCFANIIFSQLFKKDLNSDVSFGSNLLGAVCGGFAEYLSLALGYRMLLIFVGLFYILALGFNHGKTHKILA